jgi:hypothetical protein
LVWWIIAEELIHAKDFLQAGDIQTVGRWQEKMDQIRVGQNLGLVDVMEFSASRICTRLLAAVCSDVMGNLGRSSYYEDKYRQSLGAKDMVHVDISRVWRQVFTPTGFDLNSLPKSAENPGINTGANG